MAKSKTQAGKLPKRIAGVKLPKAVRASGDKLVSALHHPLIADIAAAALLAAAAALRENDGARKAARKTGSASANVAKGIAGIVAQVGAKAKPRRAGGGLKKSKARTRKK